MVYTEEEEQNIDANFVVPAMQQQFERLFAEMTTIRETLGAHTTRLDAYEAGAQRQPQARGREGRGAARRVASPRLEGDRMEEDDHEPRRMEIIRVDGGIENEEEESDEEMTPLTYS